MRYAAVVVSVLVLSSCDTADLAESGDSGDGGGSDNPPSAPTIHLDAVGLDGSIDRAAPVVVNGVADQDGAVDTSFEVVIPLGQQGLDSDPGADGPSAGGTLHAETTDGGATTSEFLLDVTINP